MTDRIAFIGVGNMGNPMAEQLVKAGKKVKAYDVSQEMIKKAKEANLDVVETLDEVLEDANFIISMLPEGKHVKSLFLGEQGIIDKISKHTNKKFKLILTGGYSHLFIKSIKQKAYIDKDITIKGLLKITELL